MKSRLLRVPFALLLRDRAKADASMRDAVLHKAPSALVHAVRSEHRGGINASRYTQRDVLRDTLHPPFQIDSRPSGL
jgi:hypothetical protein